MTSCHFCNEETLTAPQSTPKYAYISFKIMVFCDVTLSGRQVTHHHTVLKVTAMMGGNLELQQRNEWDITGHKGLVKKVYVYWD